MQTCRILVPLYSAYQPRLHQKFHSSASVMKPTNEICFLIVMAAYIHIYIYREREREREREAMMPKPCCYVNCVLNLGTEFHC